MCGLPAFLYGLDKWVVRMINKQALDEAIHEKYIRPIQRPRRLYAGLEFELPVVNLAQSPWISRWSMPWRTRSSPGLALTRSTGTTTETSIPPSGPPTGTDYPNLLAIHTISRCFHQKCTCPYNKSSSIIYSHIRHSSPIATFCYILLSDFLALVFALISFQGKNKHKWNRIIN